MALQSQGRRSLRLLLQEQAALVAKFNRTVALDSLDSPACRHFLAACSSAQLQQGHKFWRDDSRWGQEAVRGFHISIQGHQSAQAAAVQQQEEEDSEPELSQSASDPACAARKEDVKQSEKVDARPLLALDPCFMPEIVTGYLCLPFDQLLRSIVLQICILIRSFRLINMLWALPMCFSQLLKRTVFLQDQRPQ